MGVLTRSALPGNALSGSFLDQVGQAVSSSALGSVGLSQATTRQNVASMFQYSDNTIGPSPSIVFPSANQDWRVRISLAPNANYFYADTTNTLLSPLWRLPGGIGPGSNSIVSNLASLAGIGGASRIGVIFPYTPQVQITHSATYSEQALTHSNYKNYFYDNSSVSAISLTGEFTVQSVDEGQYLLASIYFFRSITKMFFGADPEAGNPPPIVYLNGYGQYYLPNVPCVITSFSHTMPADVDYIDVPEPYATNTGYNPQVTSARLNSTRLPTTSTVTVALQPVYSRVAQSQGFSLRDFSRGALVNAANSGNPATAFGASQKAGLAKFKPQGGFL
jgi:hypothetical protein